jgi:hypothetical protein
MSFLRHGQSFDPMSDGAEHDAALSSIRQRRTQPNAESRPADPLPALIGFDELQLVIPGRVGLHQSPPPLHQPADSMRHSPPVRRAFCSERQTVSHSLVSAEGSTSDRVRESGNKRTLRRNAPFSHHTSEIGAPDATSGKPFYLPSRSSRTDDAPACQRACGDGFPCVSGGRSARGCDIMIEQALA